MTLRIVTDSTCDLPAEVIAERQISLVPLYVNIGGASFLDGVELSRRDFYDRLPKAHPAPTTSAPGTEAFGRVYERLADEGATGIVSIHIGSSLSNVYNVAQLAAADFERIPVHVIDGGQITLGTGLLVTHAAELAAAGRPLDEVVASVSALAQRTHSFAALDTLEYLRRSGRVNHFAFGVGTLLQLKPILKMHAGRAETDRARTSSGAIDRMIDLAAGLGPLEKVALVHSNALERLETLRQRLTARLPDVPIVLVGEVAPVIGVHVGPGAVGVVCVAAAAPADHQHQASQGV